MGRRGPRPKPTALRLLDGKRDVTGHRSINPDEPKLPPGTDDEWARPGDLHGDAAEEWERQVGPLRDLGVLALADRTMFATYCRIYGDLRTYERLVAQVGPEAAIRLGYQGVLTKLRQQVRQYAAEFGLTASSRPGVKGGGGAAKPGKLQRFLGGAGKA